MAAERGSVQPGPDFFTRDTTARQIRLPDLVKDLLIGRTIVLTAIVLVVGLLALLTAIRERR